MTAERPVLETDGLGKSFGSKRVLAAAAFSARHGRITTLMGRNGSGKTTMLGIAVGRVKPDYGRVLYKGRFLPRPRLARLAADGLMYSAQASALTSLFSIREHLDAYAEVYGGHGRVAEVVRRLDLGEILPRRPDDVSGGERQRASLGLALLRSPDCLLMDEPFSGVAPPDRPRIAEGLRDLRDLGAAIVITGHDVEDLLDLSDEVIWVVGGTTHWLGTPAEAREHHQFRREYLGPRAGLAEGAC